MFTLELDRQGLIVFHLPSLPTGSSDTDYVVKVYPDREKSCDPVYDDTVTGVRDCSGWVRIPLTAACDTGSLQLSPTDYWVEIWNDLDDEILLTLTLLKVTRA